MKKQDNKRKFYRHWNLKSAFRKIGIFNNYENELLTSEFADTVQQIKEKNSKTVFDMYYMPKAASAILKEQGYLATDNAVFQRASAMMFMDLSDGTLTEFYRFKA